MCIYIVAGDRYVSLIATFGKYKFRLLVKLSFFFFCFKALSFALHYFYLTVISRSVVFALFTKCVQAYVPTMSRKVLYTFVESIN